ncbi:MAG: tyrosine-type recombinase/integrase [Hassallia sp. WJT32-NPBG1]|jgi:integrase/recombinase XerD|nr:tyrosine-type recombinase/integrase [Hassallia sp. WJT32-NPBG1]
MLVHQEQAGLFPTRPKLADIHNDAHLIEMWLKERERRSKESLRAYDRDIRRFLTFVEGKAIATVNYNDLQAYQSALEKNGYSRATVNRHMAAIKSILSYGHKLGYLPFNVGAVVKLSDPKNTMAERILDVMQVMTIITLEPNPRNKLILHFLYSSGGRISEVCNLTWRDLKAVGDRAQVTFFGKGEKTRVVPLKKPIWDALLAAKPSDATPDDPVFVSRKRNVNNGGIRSNQVREIVKLAGERAGIKGVSCHWFRHSHASHALDNGASLQLVKESLGHSSVTITERYLHAKPSDGSSLHLPF